MPGNPFGTATKRTWLSGTPCSSRTELISRVPMLFVTLTPIRACARSVMLVSGDPGRVYRAWLFGCISEPSATISRFDWRVTWS